MVGIREHDRCTGRVGRVVSRSLGYLFAGIVVFNLPGGVGQFDDLSASVPPLSSASGQFQRLPAGWPEPAPVLEAAPPVDTWSQVRSACNRFGIPGKAVAMYRVLWAESGLKPDIVSHCGRYEGIAQFLPSTFEFNVGAMRRAGLLPEGVEYSPFDPGQAILVMAYMWSKGYERHWGPYRRVARELLAESGATGSSE